VEVKRRAKNHFLKQCLECFRKTIDGYIFNVTSRAGIYEGDLEQQNFV